MPINLTVALTLPNATRVLVSNVHADEESEVMYLNVEMRTTSATNHVVSTRAIVIRNGVSDQLVRGTLTANGPLTDALQKNNGTLNTPTGFTDALNAWRGNATASGRKAALEAYLLSVGIVDSVSLAGT
jgi:hypothetical protein